MALDELRRRAMRVHDLYDELNLAARGRVWTREEFMLGFVGDVGDLAKLVMAAEGARDLPGGRGALEHELADCLWSVLVLADKYGVDLDAVFGRTMDELEAVIQRRLQAQRSGSGREQVDDRDGADDGDGAAQHGRGEPAADTRSDESAEG